MKMIKDIQPNKDWVKLNLNYKVVPYLIKESNKVQRSKSWKGFKKEKRFK